METIKFVQTWNPVAGRKQEYGTFITNEFQPRMKALGLEVVSGWYTLVGGGPRIVVESLAESMDRVENALDDESYHEMLDRFMNLVTHYANCVQKPAKWMTMHHQRLPSPQEVRYVQAWDVLPGQQETYKHFARDVYLPQMEAIGLGVTAGWHLMCGSGRQVVSEAPASNLAGVAKALSDERFMRMIIRMEELVTHYESRVMTRHRIYLDILHDIHGRAIRSVTPDAMHSMVGPIDE